MDDCTFDRKTALKWIQNIESPSGPRDQDTYPKISNWIFRISPPKILDIGCGQGVASAKIDLAAREYIGLEPSKFLVDRAQKLYKAENRNFVVGSVYDIPLPDENFDAVFSISVWHLLSNLSLAAKELHRVLKPGGRFLIITANPSSYYSWTSQYTKTKVKDQRFVGTLEYDGKPAIKDTFYLYTQDDLMSSFSNAHLEVQFTENFRSSKIAPEEDLFLLLEGQKPL